MPVYNKLVRDRIPEIIESTGQKAVIQILDNEEYIKELKKKAFEELEEYINVKNDKEALEELADVLEIVHALADYHGASFETLEGIRIEKAIKRGAFKERIFLKEVEE
ncbi:nucleoside triphosphate pyrophosphohydrolase [Neobacillus terrae]|uniref:nucleoside triphosphate pyrophosphohydrolase n=1 Tax=Neobacillus terrae TaxID=3034837 RepID=UPI00140BE591|nr:nucleoside triphosphate pyrophosphohydrolase [Neobacillus terrae]NHM30661.1 nucleoside triphosphate pyrophosphohydrolase [Neobacillus terrae]